MGGRGRYDINMGSSRLGFVRVNNDRRKIMGSRGWHVLSGR